jgi:hypothetical protein
MIVRHGIARLSCAFTGAIFAACMARQNHRENQNHSAAKPQSRSASAAKAGLKQTPSGWADVEDPDLVGAQPSWQNQNSSHHTKNLRISSAEQTTEKTKTAQTEVCTTETLAR